MSAELLEGKGMGTSEGTGRETGERGSPRREARFPDTRWSLIVDVAATEEGARERALEEICRIYWYPVYAFVRSRGCDPHHAEDMTQNLFLKFLSRESFGKARPERGKLRTYLLTSMTRLLANEARRRSAAKRAGDRFAVPIERGDAEARLDVEAAWTNAVTPDQQFDRRWAEAVLRRVEERLEEEHERSGRGSHFAALKGYLAGDRGDRSYAETGAALGMSEGAVKVAVHRVRKRFKMVLRDEIEQTVSDPGLVDEELRHLWGALVR